jgi:hypothetical protein
MTREEVLALSPADLNAAVAKHIFGHEWKRGTIVGTGDIGSEGEGWGTPGFPWVNPATPDYCGDGNQMLRLLQHLRDEWDPELRSNWDVDTTRTPQYREWWEVTLAPRRDRRLPVTVDDEQLGVAVARAALLSLCRGG